MRKAAWQVNANTEAGRSRRTRRSGAVRGDRQVGGAVESQARPISTIEMSLKPRKDVSLGLCARPLLSASSCPELSSGNFRGGGRWTIAKRREIVSRLHLEAIHTDQANEREAGASKKLLTQISRGSDLFNVLKAQKERQCECGRFWEC